ncbi:ASCH domain-containing protein [Corynebacterium sp. 335C]
MRDDGCPAQSAPDDASSRDDGLPVCEFAFPGELRDRLVAAVLSGAKTATSALAAEYESAGEPLPRPGDREAVVGSDGRAVCVIEYTDVSVTPLGAVGDDVARAEGEGFAGRADWLAAHLDFWGSADFRAAMGDAMPALDDATPVVVQRFRVAAVLPAA